MTKPRIGWIGTGMMGKSMAGHLLSAGYEVHTYSRTREKANALLEAGAIWQESPGKVATHVDTLFTMVGFPEDVYNVYLGQDGVLASARSGLVMIDMTTTKPSLAQRIHAAGTQKGVQFLDAPVSGGDVGARNASLSIMVGGDEATLDQVKPLLQLLGKSIAYQGSTGTGQHTKMVNQISIAGTMIGVCEALLYGKKAGLDLNTVLSCIRHGAAGSWTLDNLGPRILSGNFEPGFFVDHFIKDMEIALEEAARMNLSLPGLALVNQLYHALKAQGKGHKGTHALYLALQHLSTPPVN